MELKISQPECTIDVKSSFAEKREPSSTLTENQQRDAVGCGNSSDDIVFTTFQSALASIFNRKIAVFKEM